MIRINLQKNLVFKKTRAVSINSRLVLPLGLGGVFVLGLVLAFTLFRGSDHEKREPEAKPLASGVKPSTHYRPNMVEDVVKEVGSRRHAGRTLDIPYEHMSVAEKINYEVHFARNVVVLLDRAMPAGIGLVTLEIDKFQTVYALGLGSSRGLVESMFAAFRKEKVELLPQPLSYIKSEAGGGYRFVVTCKADFGLDLSDPFQVIDHLPFRDGLNREVRRFSGIASENKVRLTKSPRQLSSRKTGSYRRILYRVEGESTYRDFVRFILNLHKENFPAAFEKINLRAGGGERVRLDMDVLFTVKE